MSEPEDVVVGIDVAKASLEVAVRPSGEERCFANELVGIAEVVVWLQALGPRVIVVEATGGYEAPLVAELGVATLPVAVVNPRQVRDARPRHRTLGEDRPAGRAGAGPFR
jgi:transposase